MKTMFGGLGAFCPDTTSKPGARAIAPRAALRSSVRRVTSFGISIFAPLPLNPGKLSCGADRNAQAYLMGRKVWAPGSKTWSLTRLQRLRRAEPRPYLPAGEL